MVGWCTTDMKSVGSVTVQPQTGGIDFIIMSIRNKKVDHNWKLALSRVRDVDMYRCTGASRNDVNVNDFQWEHYEMR